MPQAKKPAPRPSRPSAAFREPAALRKLSRSLDAAQEALAELSKDAGRDVGQGARDLYKDLRTFLSSARRDTGRLAKALQRDFTQAQKRLGGPGRSTRPAGGSAPSRARGAARSGTAARKPRARTPARGATGAARATILEALVDGQAMTGHTDRGRDRSRSRDGEHNALAAGQSRRDHEGRARLPAGRRGGDGRPDHR